MNNLKQMLNFKGLRQWLAIFLAGVVMLVSTACSAAKATTPPGANPSLNRPNATEGMYPHKDTERDTSAADAKAERMIREANQRTNQFQSPKDWVDEVTPDQSLGDQAKDIKQSAQRAAKQVGESTRQAAENAVDNTQGALDRAGDLVD
jgi:hypothetical protein